VFGAGTGPQPGAQEFRDPCVVQLRVLTAQGLTAQLDAGLV